MRYVYIFGHALSSTVPENYNLFYKHLELLFILATLG